MEVNITKMSMLSPINLCIQYNENHNDNRIFVENDKLTLKFI